MGDFSRGFEASNEENPQWCDVQVSIPMLYASSSVEKQCGNLYEQFGLWDGDPSVLMAVVQPAPPPLPPPPPSSYVAGIHAPTMHPNLVSTLKSLIDVDGTVDMNRGGIEVENNDNNNTNNNNKEEDIAIVPVDLIQNRRPFRCTHSGCNKTFKNPQTLKMHHKTHYSEQGGVFRVENSHRGKGSSRAGHNKKIPSRCPVCRRTFVGLYELRRHFGRKHSEGEKMHACRKCGKRFYIEVDLRDHEKLCGEPIECKCGMKFAFKCNLVAHKKTHPECQDSSSSSSADDCKTSEANYSLFQHTSSAAKINSNDDALITGKVMAGAAEGFAEMPVMFLAGGVKLEDIDLSCINQGVCS